jgi:3-hydroxyisobutyrate dehydrogenase-like beta-hydroxyacid dehydrogenase
VERFDVAVVGAGPAGSTAAYRLAREENLVLLYHLPAAVKREALAGGRGAVESGAVSARVAAPDAHVAVVVCVVGRGAQKCELLKSASVWVRWSYRTSSSTSSSNRVASRSRIGRRSRLVSRRGAVAFWRNCDTPLSGADPTELRVRQQAPESKSAR